MIDPVASALAKTVDAAPASSGATASAGAASKTVSQSDFLKLFVAQLQHQDPLSPLEPNELTAQLAQFSSLEQLTGVNTRLDGIAQLSKQANGAALLSMLGREVSFDGGQTAVQRGKAAPVQFTLDGPADKVTATVQSADGTLVRVVELGAEPAGTHAFQFDGRGSSDLPVPDGTYKVSITALRQGEKTPTALSLVTRLPVDGADLSSDPPVLLVGGLRIPLDQVHEVNAVATQAGASR